MQALPNQPRLSQRHQAVEARPGSVSIAVKFGVDALRTLRTSLMQVAYAVMEGPASHGYVVLVDSPITKERLCHEWARAATVLRDDVLDRLTICLLEKDRMIGIPHDLAPATQRMLAAAADAKRAGKSHIVRTDYSFVILKVLLHQWLISGDPVTMQWLAHTAGCSYPAVARALRPLGSLLERQSDRRVALRWFPKEEFARLLALSGRARSTTRFADQSNVARSPESHVRRLEKLAPAGLAIGGVLGAKTYFPDLNLVGTPRLDLSVHCPGHQMNLDFMEKLDPALKPVADPLTQAHVVVHAVRHADPQFMPRLGGLAWADPVECLLDLHEDRLTLQASQFLEALENNRPLKA